MKFIKSYGIGSEQSARKPIAGNMNYFNFFGSCNLVDTHPNLSMNCSGRCPSLTVDVCSVSPHLMETEAVTSPLNALNQGLLS